MRTCYLFKKIFLIFTILIINCHGHGNIKTSHSGEIFTDLNKTRKIINVLETHLNIITQILQRNRILAVQSANGIYQAEERKIFDLEFQQLFAEIIQIKKSASIKKIFLFKKAGEKYPDKIFLKLDDTIINFPLLTLPVKKFKISAWQKKTIYNELNIRTSKNAGAAIKKIDLILEHISYERARISAFSKRLNYHKALKELLAGYNDLKEDTIISNNNLLKNIAKNRELANVMDIYLNVITQILLHSRTLAIQSSNGFYNNNDHLKLDLSFQELYNEIARLREHASYKGITLFNSQRQDWLKTLQVRLNNRKIVFELTNLPALNFGLTGWDNKNIHKELHIRNPAHSNKMIKQIDQTLKFLAFQRGRINAFLSRLKFSSDLVELLASDIQE